MTKGRFTVKKPYFSNKIYLYDKNHAILAINNEKKDGGLLLFSLDTYARRYRYDVDKVRARLKIVGSDLIWE